MTDVADVDVASARVARRALVVATTLVCALGFAAELGHYLFALPGRAGAFFSLSEEANLPTWYSTCLLAECSAELFRIGAAAHRDRAPGAAHWLGLGAIFAFMSLDEAVELHEYLAYVVEGRGVFYFSWVLPASVILVVLAAVFVRFVLALGATTRRRFVIAGLVYVTGALLCELPLGLWTERHGDANLGYALIDFVEETLEMVGAGAFLVALLEYRASVR